MNLFTELIYYYLSFNIFFVFNFIALFIFISTHNVLIVGTIFFIFFIKRYLY
jgi:hypothetical protein